MKMRKFFISKQALTSFEIKNGAYNTPDFAKNFVMEVPGEDFTLCFHNIKHNGRLDGEVEVCLDNATLAYADVCVKNGGEVEVSNLYLNPVYEHECAPREYVRFIKKSVYSAAVLACLRQIQRVKSQRKGA